MSGTRAPHRQGRRALGLTMLALALLIVSALASPAPALAASPHLGARGSDTCGMCHVPHRATSRLLFRDYGWSSGELPVCYDCHDGTGSVTNIKTGPDSFGRSSGHVLESLADTSTPADLTNTCSDCHKPHGDYVKRPDLPASKVNSVTVTGRGNAWCLTCHNASQDWYAKKGAYPSLTAPARDASGYPVAGTFPGPAVYADKTKNAHVLIPTSSVAPTRAAGDCLFCHAAHGGPSRYDGLVATFSPSTTSSVAGDRSTGAYAGLCFKCHAGGSWETSGAANIKRYVTFGATDTFVGAAQGHRVKSAGGALPVDAPLPCYECHNPHGSSRGNANLLSDAVGGSLTASAGASATAIRKTCLGCHTTWDGLGWDSTAATYAAVPSTATVQGLPRTGGPDGSGNLGGGNWLKLRDANGHYSADTSMNCYDCHGRDYSAASSNNVHAPKMYDANTHVSTNGSGYIQAIDHDGDTFACSDCHTMSLLPLHANYCTACHGRQASAAVKGAIAAGNTSCTACHSGDHAFPGGHPSDDYSCGGCHGSGCYCHSAWVPVPTPHTDSDVKASYINTATINLWANDAVYGSFGIKRTYYRLDGAPAATGTPITVAAPATGTVTHTLSYWSTDWSGNTETPHDATFTVAHDSFPPTTTSNVVPAKLYTGDTTFTLTAVDANSAVAGTRWQLDSTTGTWSVGTTVPVLGPMAGTDAHTLYFYSFDTWANTETVRSVGFSVTAGREYSLTGAVQTFVVPSGVVTIGVTLNGGAGGNDYYTQWYGPTYGLGGLGGQVSAVMTVTPLSTLSVYVGGAGSTNVYYPNPGGWPNGARANTYAAGGGGGSSSIWFGSSVLAEAGGGGGAGYYYAGCAGGAGGSQGTLPGGFKTGTISTFGYAGGGGGGWNAGLGGSGTYRGGTGGTSYIAFGTGTLTPGANAGNGSVTIRYSKGGYALVYTAGTGGTISGTTPQVVAPGTNGTTVTAVPNTGYHFVEWSDGVTTAARRELNVNADKVLTANFAIDTYSLTYAAGANGTLTGTLSQTVNHGASGTTVTAVPDSGYHFENWSDGSTANPRRDTNVTATVSVTANFAINLPCVLTYNAGAHGSIVGTSPQSVPFGTSGTTVTAVPDTHYHFVNWSDGSTANPRRDLNVITDTSVTANFAINTHVVAAYAGTGGSISPSGAADVDEGTDRTYTIAATGGYTISEVFVDGVSQGAIGSYTFTAVAASHTIVAAFTAPGGETTQSTSVSTAGDTPWMDADYNASGPFGTYEIYADGVLIGTKQADGISTWDCPLTPVASGARIDIVLYAGFDDPVEVYDSHTPVTYTFWLPAGSTRLSAATWGGFSDIVTGDGFDGTDWGYPQDPYTWVAVPGTAITNIVYATGVPIQYALIYGADVNGSVSGASPQFVLSGGSGTTVTAVPDAGYHFVDWSDGSTAISRRDTSVNENRSVHAHFASGTAYTLDYLAGANGSITGTSPQTVVSGGSGTPVTAAPNTGYHFTSWSDGSTANPRTDTNVTANTSVTASFAINTYQLKYFAGANGTLSGTTSQTVNHGGSGTAVTAVPNTGYHFTSWSDGSTANPRTDTNVTSNTSVTANFAINTYTVTYMAGVNGSLLGTASQTIAHGDSGTPVTAVGNSGYHFVKWSDESTTNPRTETNVTANKILIATFGSDLGARLTYNAGANGSISGTSTQLVPYGGSGTPVTAVPNTGYRFLNWTDGSTANPRQDTNVSVDVSVTANFTILTYQIYSSYYAGGSLSPLGWVTVNHGASQTYNATPNGGYRVACFLTDYDYVNGWRLPAASYTFSNVTAGHWIYGYFAASNTRTLIYTYGVNGYTSAGTTPQYVVSGSNGPTVTALPNGGYHFEKWSDESTANPRKDLNVTADRILTPVFAPNTYSMKYAAAANGSISGDASQAVLYASRASTVTATPDSGYRFVYWSDGYTGATRADACYGNLSVTAVFAPVDALRIVYLASGPGGLAGSTIQTVSPGGSGTAVTAQWDSYYYQFDGWSDALMDPTRTDTNVTQDATYTANFSQWYFGSCPFLFTWNGSEYKFEADQFTTGKLASQRAGGTYQKPNPHDYYVLRTTPASIGGQLEAKLVEERFEVDYLDTLKLYAIDVPVGSDIAAKKIPQGGSYQPLEEVVRSVSSSLTKLPATHVQDGTDVSAKVARTDGSCAILSPEQEKPSYQSIELDLGELSGASTVKLVVEGATRFPKTDAGKLLGAAGVRQRVEVIGADGQWTALPGEWPKPAEFSRPYLLDLTGKFPTEDHRVRLTFLLKTYIDSVRLDTTADVPLKVTEVPLNAAQLGHHGLDPLVPFGDLLKFTYGPPAEFDGYLQGLYTRFGEVTPLLTTTDDKFVVFGGGDELTLHFREPAPAPVGMTRRYVLYTNGYYKDLNTDVAHTVDPLPFGAMTNYPYPPTQQYPGDQDHVDYLDEWNTRPEGF